jgi:ABC-2 type transport system ATP-binding protein
MNLIETIGLTHRFSNSELALDNIDIRVEEGSIYGFLGPNGAGKTTTLKLILGLLRKQQGEIRIFGHELGANRLRILSKIGSLIESPSLYGHLTARENLEVLRLVYKCPLSRIDEVLSLVGLADTGKKKASEFSLGMKQRLSIAIALLHDPKLLILDEPTNGLDPNGIVEMRELLRRLSGESGITILISSHLLAEIEKLVTHVGIINLGKMVFQGTLAELGERRQRSSFISIRTSDNAEALEVVQKHSVEAAITDGIIKSPLIGDEALAGINRDLVGRGLSVYSLGRVESDLETIFFDVINN